MARAVSAEAADAADSGSPPCWSPWRRSPDAPASRIAARSPRRVSAALRALPGIDRVDGQYANGITVGQSYNLTVILRADAGDPELTALAQTYDQQVAAADLAGHTLRLTLQSADGDRLTLYGRDGRLESTAPTTRRW
jgi:hypothetical protein